MADRNEVQTVVEYRTGLYLQRRLPVALWSGVAGLLLIAAGEAGLGFILMALAAGFTAFMLYPIVRSGAPVLRLAPAAMTVNLPGSKPLDIPWSELRGVETVSYTVHHGGRPGGAIRFRDITVALVSPQFHEEKIAPSWALAEGSLRETYLRTVDGMPGIALHHEEFSAIPQQVRGPVEARWHAYGRGTPFFGRSNGEVVRFGDALSLGAPLHLLNLAAPLLAMLVIVANMTGHWETDAQRERREAREETRRRASEEETRFRDETAARRQRIDEMLKRMEEERERMNRRFPFRPPSVAE